MKPLYQFIKKSFLFLIPVWILLMVYFIKDPFKVIYHYENYYPEYGKSLFLNMAYVSTQNYANHVQEVDYDSYILGSSRSRFYRCSTWSSLVNSNKTYHFEGSSENLEGMCRKIEWLDDQKANMKNVLLVIDHSLLSNKPLKGHLFCTPPQYGSLYEKWTFHTSHLTAFFDIKFLSKYIDFLIYGQVKQYMIDDGVFPHPFKYDAIHNEITLAEADSLIAIGQYYNDALLREFDLFRDAKEQEIGIIKDEQIMLLSRIADVMNKNKADVKVVINPLYDKQKLSDKDLNVLKSIFGANRVYDFSGVNSITQDYHNYYDWSHCRAHICDSLLNIMYAH